MIRHYYMNYLEYAQNFFNAFFSCRIFKNNLNAFYRSDNRDFEWKKEL